MYLVKTIPIELGKGKTLAIGEKFEEELLPKQTAKEFLAKGFIEKVAEEVKAPAVNPTPEVKAPEANPTPGKDQKNTKDKQRGEK